MANANFPKYQWSYFINGERNSQIVVRADDTTEMENAIVKILPIIEKINDTTKKVEPDPEPVQPGLTATCEVHNIPMKEYTSKKTGNPYWAHFNAQGKPCFGKGYAK